VPSGTIFWHSQSFNFLLHYSGLINPRMIYNHSMIDSIWSC
jgi:hypothetical protein